ncbi:MAG TPA: DNA polymerase I [Acidimicrobiales bacterium]|nr:DNA polymerase I [Acidimicrobiales bacterium]
MTTPPTTSGALYLLDGNSLVFRAFFALPTDLATTAGQVTNAVHGFTSMVVMLLRDQSPSGMAVAFDRPEPTFRDEVVPDYKGNRPETPDLLVPQFALVRHVLGAMGIPILEVPGFEADDVLATLATLARDAGRDVVVVTGDRDCFQLVEDPHVKVMYTRRGISDTVVYDEAGILERTGVPATRYPVLAALRGDPSDNLAGVPGVGEKTAAKLVNTYGDLDAIFSHVTEQTPKLRQSLADHEDEVRRNAQVIPLRRDVELPVGIDDLSLGHWEGDRVREVFAELELKSLWGRLAPIMGDVEAAALPRSTAQQAAVSPFTVDLSTVVPDVPESAKAGAAIAVLAGPDVLLAAAPWWSGEPGRSPLVGLALADITELVAQQMSPGQDSQPTRPPTSEVLWLTEAALGHAEVTAALADLLGSGGARLVGHGVKELMRSLLPSGVDVTALEMDTAVAAYLLDPSSSSYRLEELADARLGVVLGDGAADGSRAGQLALEQTAAVDLPAEAAKRAVVLGGLAAVLRRSLEAAGLDRLHDEVERPLVRVLARMEVAGIAVDSDVLRRVSKELAVQCQTLEAQVHELAGEVFNVNSTPQLRTVLYEKLGLSPGRRTKTGYSTDAATLERLRDQHPIVETLLQYREVEKLRSTYGESLLAEVADDGRIHATFHQTVARTGRLSSDRPNLHNIPVRSEIGRQLRAAFVPAAGCRLLVSDYDQIELRVIAHLSGDPGLVAAFAEHRDIHRTTAARVFGVAPQQVTAAQRNRAKMVSYGLAYGMEAYGLAQRLNIETPEAQAILDAYFAAFPAVRAYMDATVAEARSKGYTVTLFGRRRPLPDLNSPNRNLRMAAERQARNAGIQGLAADLFKVALVKLDAALEERKLRARLVLQVHDEVLVEVPHEEADMVGSLVPAVMAAVAAEADLAVPLEVSSTWGESWAEAKG